jgi:hypothetical protein
MLYRFPLTFFLLGVASVAAYPDIARSVAENSTSLPTLIVYVVLNLLKDRLCPL